MGRGRLDYRSRPAMRAPGPRPEPAAGASALAGVGRAHYEPMKQINEPVEGFPSGYQMPQPSQGYDDALVDSVAKAICDSAEADDWDNLPAGIVKELYRQQAKAAIRAVFDYTRAFYGV